MSKLGKAVVVISAIGLVATTGRMQQQRRRSDKKPIATIKSIPGGARRSSSTPASSRL